MCELYNAGALTKEEDNLFLRRWIPALILITLAAATPQTRRPARPAAEKAPLTDAELARAIRERLARSKCAADNFSVRVRGGVATLEGRTDVVQRKGAATRMAKTAGARKVINKIQVSEAAKRKASANLTKGRQRAQVKRSEAKRR
jgi:osmotically-inducible protein OsmY